MQDMFKEMMKRGGTPPTNDQVGKPVASVSVNTPASKPGESP